MCDFVWVKIASIIVMQFFSPLLVMERLQANALLRRNSFLKD